ncbi:cyclic AMP-responsive element-binding protein [Perilla frutescens var. hirtella]|uniref:Cyclic AMP-responsive element-binding protein n=1 Tax=Perilla frutescens var. hirtella TaxID=608512 RepID=A0AAD4IPE0_PERFH|nr:cyclic AMP-responsive element-binding protein [Perilla frutescens var. hirtella]KAH6766843.1 cyclic AMP-responsive element-binding protein [Perilla frutescens var. hirtella]KAH6811587.1 cyclic AMP-responsive element-binding protein [Perilla frutescens var. frutescens]KAH6813619.1 cyclic AMP-responsive element-binding protein [Perilla frutescens var. frutescens]
MEVFGKSMVPVHSNVIFLSSILGQDGPNPVHKCDWKCENENVFGNMYRCKLTGLTHVCDKNCNQRIVYDNHSSLCRVSKQTFPLTPVEQQAVRGVRRKLDAENSSTESCAFKRRRDAQCHPSPFERPFTTVGPICSPIGDGMDMN